MLRIVLPLLFGVLLSAASFSSTKKVLNNEIYTGAFKQTFYADCTYSGKGFDIQWSGCDYVPKKPFTSKGKHNDRTTRIEWEHVMPAENFGRQFSCWRDGDPECVYTGGKKKGERYKGRKCCEKVSHAFREIEADPNNLVPSIGELNGDRSNYRYTQEEKNENITGQYGNVPFLVDSKNRRVYVRDGIKGDIARKYFYMWDKYKLKYSESEARMMIAWDKLDPVDENEAFINKKIQNVFGYSNPYISR